METSKVMHNPCKENMKNTGTKQELHDNIFKKNINSLLLKQPPNRCQTSHTQTRTQLNESKLLNTKHMSKAKPYQGLN